MADRPIIFSASMILAMLAGRKTQTRRILKLPARSNGHAIYERKDMGGWEPTINGGGGCFTIARDGSRVPAPETVGIWHRTCGVCLDAPYQVGHRLWVREVWRTESKCYDDLAPSAMGGEETILFDADAEGQQNKTTGRRRASMHMPRWASRLTLYVTDVRVERLDDMSAEDAFAEGIRFTLEKTAGGGSTSGWGIEGLVQGNGPQHAFSLLWEKINGADSWAANPWVVALTFAIHRGNIDSAPSSLFVEKEDGRG